MNPDELIAKKCVPCEGGVPKLSAAEADQYRSAVSHWSLNDEGTMIQRKVVCKSFVAAMELVNRIADIAESQQHHPDLHVTGYRNVKVVLTTHAIGGLSENDFIVAAHIDKLLPVAAR